MTQREKVLSSLGLAAKAGKIESGEFATEKTVKNGRGKLVIVAEDASDNTKKMFRNLCDFYKVPHLVFGSKEELGHWVGKTYRACVCLSDEGFAKAVIRKINRDLEV